MNVGVRVLDGTWDYEPVWQAMKTFTESRSADTQDEIWVLQHRPVFTQGQAGKPEHLLFTGDIPVVQSDRGGQVTYHGPGQLMAYILVDIKRANMGPRDLVDSIECALVELLAQYGITAQPDKDAPGVYVGKKKIASLGLRIRKGLSFHGLALNVEMDLEPFHRINPCGYAGMEMTQIADYVSQPDIQAIGQKLIASLQQTMSYKDVVDLGSQLP
jgi:lipoyl(octanoyl) transferase